VHGDLNLYGWVFDIRSGEVHSFDPSQGKFAPLPGGPDEGVDLPSAVAPPLTAAHFGHAFKRQSGIHPEHPTADVGACRTNT
jgi:hypothetical protein